MTEEELVASFLATKDLATLDKPLVFPTSHSFIKSEHSYALKWFMWLGCVPCLSPIAAFKTERLHGHFSLELHKDRVEVGYPINYCCSVSVERNRLLLESIVDITLRDDQYTRQYGLKQMNIWTYGDTEESGPSVTVSWVANPDQAREAIMLAVSLRKAAIGFVPLPTPTGTGRGDAKAAMKGPADSGNTSENGSSCNAAERAAVPVDANS